MSRNSAKRLGIFLGNDFSTDFYDVGMTAYIGAKMRERGCKMLSQSEIAQIKAEVEGLKPLSAPAMTLAVGEVIENWIKEAKHK